MPFQYRMKAIFAILFSAFFLLTSMQETAFLLLYKLNEKAITEKYCVNKNVVGSCCKGSCHLNKTIAKTENENNKNPFSTTNIKLKEVEIFFSLLNKIQEVSSLNSSEFKQNKSKNYSSNLLEGFTFSLIKPPTVLA